MFSRDFIQLPWGEGQETLVVTCDSVGAIGEMELDVVPARGLTVGRFLARVALMELLCAGAELVSLSCTFSIDPDNASRVLNGVLAEASLIHHDPQAICVLSTEKNIPTRQTGAGITCIGRIRGHEIRTGFSRHGDVVMALGTPKVGDEVTLDDPENADIPALQALLVLDGIGDISPAGSKGVLYEANVIAKSAHLQLEVSSSAHSSLLTRSAGPATSIVFSCRPHVTELLQQLNKPLYTIGTLKEDHL